MTDPMTDSSMHEEKQLVSTVWHTPIVAVLIVLLLLIPWIPSIIRTISIMSILALHIVQYSFAIYRYRMSKRMPLL